MSEYAEFSSLIGKTLRSVETRTCGTPIGSPTGDIEEVIFETAEGERFRLYHSQDCCEDVHVESIVGDTMDLIGTPILLAEEAESEQTPGGVELEYQPESQTWTFYKLRTIKGSVDIRWHGTSNGYYSESVSFEKL